MPDSFSEVAEWRRHIHARPELGYEEVKTSAFVAEKLGSFGVETHTGFAATGVVPRVVGEFSQRGVRVDPNLFKRSVGRPS